MFLYVCKTRREIALPYRLVKRHEILHFRWKQQKTFEKKIYIKLLATERDENDQLATVADPRDFFALIHCD